MARPLGPKQREFLWCLAEVGPYPGHGWHFGKASEGHRLGDSLVQRGLATYERTLPPGARSAYRGGRLAYRITDAGRTELEKS